MKKLLEATGRFGVLTTIAITMNRTEWYQNLPIQTFSNSSFEVWVFSFSIVLSLFWMLLPLYQYAFGGKYE